MGDQKKASGVFATDSVSLRRLNQIALVISCSVRLWRVDKARFSNPPTLSVAVASFCGTQRLRSHHLRT
jgi:hypothetical protein